MSIKLADVLIADDILRIVEQEVTAIKNTPDREIGDIMKLERLSKIFSVIMASNRELLKSGQLGKLDFEEELDVDLADSADND